MSIIVPGPYTIFDFITPHGSCVRGVPALKLPHPPMTLHEQ
tara:strand:- start:146 stop:268 length:123 start_codon:yes stop_codon:yes gene_type:complete